jgi:hypothetical protein
MRTLPPGNLCLIADLTRFDQGLPLHGLAEQLDHTGCLRLLRRFRFVPGLRDGTHDPVRPHPPHHRTHVALLERPLRTQGDLDGLFADGIAKCAVVAVFRHVDDPEPDLRLRGAVPVSRLTHSGSQMSRCTNRGLVR